MVRVCVRVRVGGRVGGWLSGRVYVCDCTYLSRHTHTLSAAHSFSWDSVKVGYLDVRAQKSPMKSNIFSLNTNNALLSLYIT